MKNIEISVIVPVKNMEKYIYKCVESILNQTEKNLELIIVDFGSNDNTIKIIKGIGDSRINLIQRELKDVAEARNLGLSIANGTYVSFIDADDWISREFYSNLIENMKKNSADIGICGYKNIEEESNKETSKKIFQSSVIQLKENNIGEFFLEAAIGEINCEAWNKIYSREFITKANVKFDSNQGINGEDMLFNYLLYMYFPTIVISDDTMYYHLLRKKSLGKIKSISVADRFKYIINTMSQFSKQNNLYNLIEEGIAMQYFSLLIFQILGSQLNFIEFMKEYRSNVIIKEQHRNYSRICFRSKYSNWKRKIYSMMVCIKMDLIFILIMRRKRARR